MPRGCARARQRERSSSLDPKGPVLSQINVPPASSVLAVLMQCEPIAIKFGKKYGNDLANALMAFGYEPVLFARALPILAEANPMLLSCGTWYVAEVPNADGALIGCGGWTRQRPDAPNDPVDPVVGNIRHFATHPRSTRRGVGRALFDR